MAEIKERLKTPIFRVSFPEVFEMKSFNNGTPRYSVTALFYPAQYKADHEAQKAKKPTVATEWERWKELLKRVNEVSVESFKKKVYSDPAPTDAGELDQIYKRPFHKGDSKTYQGFGDPAMVFATLANSLRKPEIINIDKEPITKENADEFYPGCWARASVNPYAFNNIGKGVAIGLNNLRKLKDDTRFDGFTSAEEDFGSEDDSFDVDKNETVDAGDDF